MMELGNGILGITYLMEWNQLVKDQCCQEDLVLLEENKKKTNTQTQRTQISNYKNKKKANAFGTVLPSQYREASIFISPHLHT